MKQDKRIARSQLCGSEFSWCTAGATAGGFYKLRVKDLSPTQFAAGRAEIDVRAGRMRKKLNHDPAELHDYLRVRPVPIVVRDEKFYLIDEHYPVRALYEALHETHGEDTCVFVKVLENWSSLDDVYFWKAMYEHNCVYLFDCHGGGPQPPKALPSHIKDLEFDPYRSLAWTVRNHQGYLKTEAPFSEFKWANFFRNRILLDQDILAGKHIFIHRRHPARMESLATHATVRTCSPAHRAAKPPSNPAFSLLATVPQWRHVAAPTGSRQHPLPGGHRHWHSRGSVCF